MIASAATEDCDCFTQEDNRGAEPSASLSFSAESMSSKLFSLVIANADDPTSLSRAINRFVKTEIEPLMSRLEENDEDYDISIDDELDSDSTALLKSEDEQLLRLLGILGDYLYTHQKESKTRLDYSVLVQNFCSAYPFDNTKLESFKDALFKIKLIELINMGIDITDMCYFIQSELGHSTLWGYTPHKYLSLRSLLLNFVTT